MNFLGYPIEIWIAAFIAVLIRLRSSNSLTVFGAIATILVALGSGVILYQPVLVLFSLSLSWQIPVAILIALTAENLMKAIVDVSADKDILKDWVTLFINRKGGDPK